MIKFALKFILLILVALVVWAGMSALGNRAHSQEPGYHVPEVGRVVFLNGFCVASDHDGVNRIKAALGNQDVMEYSAVMRDPGTQCFDAKMLRTGPLQVTFLRIESTMDIQKGNVDLCMLFMIMLDGDGVEVWTWQSAQATRGGEVFRVCPGS